MVQALLVNNGKIVIVDLGSDPQLEWETGSEGSENDKVFFVQNNPLVILQFLVDDVAHHAALLEKEIVANARQFNGHEARCHGNGDDLRVAVAEAGPRLRSVVLEDHDVPEPLILLEVHQPAPVYVEHIPVA